MFCKYYQEEVCVNADCEKLADFPSEEYCGGECEHFTPASREDAYEYAKFHFDLHTIANMKVLRGACLTKDGRVMVPTLDSDNADHARERFERAHKMLMEFVNADNGNTPESDGRD